METHSSTKLCKDFLRTQKYKIFPLSVLKTGRNKCSSSSQMVPFILPAVGLEGLRRKACTNQEGRKDNKEMLHQFHLSENIFIPHI